MAILYCPARSVSTCTTSSIMLLLFSSTECALHKRIEADDIDLAGFDGVVELGGEFTDYGCAGGSVIMILPPALPGAARNSHPLSSLRLIVVQAGRAETSAQFVGIIFERDDQHPASLNTCSPVSARPVASDSNCARRSADLPVPPSAISELMKPRQKMLPSSQPRGGYRRVVVAGIPFAQRCRRRRCRRVGHGWQYRTRVPLRRGQTQFSRTHPTSAVLSDGGYFAKRVTLSLALRSSGDAGRGFGRVGAAAALVAG